jgi:hypothetical protein
MKDPIPGSTDHLRAIHGRAGLLLAGVTGMCVSTSTKRCESDWVSRHVPAYGPAIASAGLPAARHGRALGAQHHAA